MLSDGIVLLYDNAHTLNLVRNKPQRFGLVTLEHPTNSPDLSPSDFHIFGGLKKDIRGRQFHPDKEVQDPALSIKLALIVWSSSGRLMAIIFE